LTTTTTTTTAAAATLNNNNNLQYSTTMDRRNRRGVDEEAASPTTPLLSAPTPPLSAVDMLRETSHVSSITLPSAASRVEEHGGHRQYIKDSVIGFADGLTVPFALTASLTA
jgi:hypothetical protein